MRIKNSGSIRGTAEYTTPSSRSVMKREARRIARRGMKKMTEDDTLFVRVKTDKPRFRIQ